MTDLPSSDCPSIERLDAFCAERQPDDAVTRHLEVCEHCRARVDDMRENDALLARIRSADLRSPDLSGAPAAAAAFSTAPGRVAIEDYRIDAEFNRGGQGIVYRALHLPTKRTVALKIILHGPLATSRQRLRFEREVELVAALRHPHIVTVHDSGVTADGRCYFAMDYIEGRPLDEYGPIADGTLPLGDLLRLFGQICAAVSYAHQRGVIHRDLKPSNILIDSEGWPNLVDFGLAKLAEAPLHDRSGRPVTLTGEFMGTLAYAAPEQLKGDPSLVDVRTDVYALGVILYEMITGRHPYPVTGPVADVVEAITRTDPIRPSAVTRESAAAIGPAAARRPALRADAEVDAIVLKALAKGPERRYQSAEHLRREIDNYLTGRPIDARRDSGWYVLKKLARRHKAPVGGVAGFLVLILGFAVSVSVLYQRTRIEAAKTYQMRVFLEDMLASAEPAQQGQDVTVREVLDEAARWAETGLRGQPELEASVHSTIGNTYRKLGLYGKAEPHLRRALDIRRQLFGEEHDEVAQSMGSLALLYNASGDRAQAEELAVQALSIRRRLLGDGHLDVAMCFNNLAYVLRDKGDHAAAEVAFRRALDIRRRLLGSDHPDVAILLYHLGEVEAAQGDFAAAESLHREALDMRRRALPLQHPDLARSLVALGELLNQQGRPAQARPLLQEALEIHQATLPAGHWRIAEVQTALGECLMALGE